MLTSSDATRVVSEEFDERASCAVALLEDSRRGLEAAIVIATSEVVFVTGTLVRVVVMDAFEAGISELKAAASDDAVGFGAPLMTCDELDNLRMPLEYLLLETFHRSF